ncbi:uncharacterized protein [Atheta coriaria]|uniref:uncharacterized protein n=1 Tax=Dalotia coriaria TaxID=877792 RepID=UPI0031F39E98
MITMQNTKESKPTIKTEESNVDEAQALANTVPANEVVKEESAINLEETIIMLPQNDSSKSSDDSTILDDVAEDFFDDFNNKEFLAGLDVVDAWEDNESESNQHSIDNENACTNEMPYTETVEKEQTNLTTSTEPENIITDAGDLKKDGPAGSKVDKLKKYTIPKRKSKSRSRSLEGKPRERNKTRKYDTDSRRDPEKVNRDIQRDKAKCEKERITEKLRILETGLVPPGTEMDEPAAATDVRQPSRPTKRIYSRSPSPFHRKRRSPPVQTIHTRKRYSPPYRRRSRTRSPIPQPLYEARYDNRRKRLRSRSHSPDRARHRSRSLNRYQKLSAERHSSKHSYDRSPDRKQSFLEELDRKLARIEYDHMKNITAKINGDISSSSHNSHNQYSHSMLGVMPVPQMVPAMDHTQYVGGASYDQSFFVGSGHVVDPNPYSVGYQQGCVSYEQMNTPAHNFQVETNEEATKKLFNDDSISLTEYLKLTQRSDNAQQIHPAHKVKVLNRCQDALTLISELQRPNGRFYSCVNRLQKIDSTQSPSTSGCGSPKFGSPIHFRFTSKRTVNEKQPTSLSRLLARLDIKEKLVILPTGDDLQQKTFEDAISQTSDYECEKCTKFKQIQRIDVAVQCMPSTQEFGANVTEDDFLANAQSLLKNVLKHQSFASLTPAQILAQLSENKDEKEERRPQQPQMQEFVRRERRESNSSSDFERRNNRPQNQQGGYPSKYHEQSGSQRNPLIGYTQQMGPGAVPPPMGIGIMGSQQGHRAMRPGFFPRRPLLNPNQPPRYGPNFGPNTMHNYPVRRYH